MGGGLALQALEKNIRVVGFDTHGASTELTGAGMVEVPGLDGFRGQKLARTLNDPSIELELEAVYMDSTRFARRETPMAVRKDCCVYPAFC